MPTASNPQNPHPMTTKRLQNPPPIAPTRAAISSLAEPLMFILPGAALMLTIVTMTNAAIDDHVYSLEPLSPNTWNILSGTARCKAETPPIRPMK